MHNFSQSKYKVGYIYLLAPQGMAIALLTRLFLKRKLQECKPLRAEINAFQAELIIENSTFLGAEVVKP